jgi:hypothetical protein
MDWITIRILTNNLGELLDQHARGEHVGPGQWGTELKDGWWAGILGLTVSLARALNVNTDDWERMHPDTRRFGKLMSLDDNHYTRHAVALVALARKLLADLDAAASAERASATGAAAAS